MNLNVIQSILILLYTYIIYISNNIYVSLPLKSNTNHLRLRTVRSLQQSEFKAFPGSATIDPKGNKIKNIFVKEIIQKYYKKLQHRPTLNPTRAYMGPGHNKRIYTIQIQEIMPSEKCIYKIYTALEDNNAYSILKQEKQDLPCFINFQRGQKYGHGDIN